MPHCAGGWRAGAAAEKVRSLLAPGQNRFYHSIGEVLRAVAVGRFQAQEMEAEAEAQILRLRKAGVRLSHFDSHKHTHMFPSILRPLLRAAVGAWHHCAAQSIRGSGSGELGEALRSARLLIRKAETTAAAHEAAPALAELVREAGFATTDGSLGNRRTGALNAASCAPCCGVCRRAPGNWYAIRDITTRNWPAVRTRLRASREVEMQALLEITASELREQYGVELAAFAEIHAAGERRHLCRARRQNGVERTRRAMRIGITCYPTYGGSGVVATELGIELANRGHEIHFISYSQPIRLTEPHPQFIPRGGSLAVSAV